MDEEVTFRDILRNKVMCVGQTDDANRRFVFWWMKRRAAEEQDECVDVGEQEVERRREQTVQKGGRFPFIRAAKAKPLEGAHGGVGSGHPVEVS